MKKNKIISFALIIFMALTLPHCSSDTRALHKKLSEMATDINKSAPVALDDNTRFDSAEVTDNNLFRYYYTVMNTDNPKQLIDTHAKAMKNDIKTSFATNPDLRIFVKNNVTIEYIYRDENRNTIRTITIHPSDYK